MKGRRREIRGEEGKMKTGERGGREEQMTGKNRRGSERDESTYKEEEI